MASFSTDKNGNRRIKFYDEHGGQKSIRIGKLNKRAAEQLCRLVEEILAARRSGQPLHPATAEQISRFSPDFRQKFERVGLVTPAVGSTPVPRLGEFLDQYLAGRPCKKSTWLNLKQAIDNVVAYFGADTPLDRITPGDADEYRTWLTTNRRKPLSENTARRHCGRAKQFFKHAVSKRLIPANPFGEMTRLTVRGTPERRFFVERHVIARVLEACPSLDWRLIVVLCRYGGLRPSEACDLRWEHIDWEKYRIRVRCKKTEHHEGREWRELPIFPEIAPYLQEAREAAPDGAEMVVAGYRSTQNLGKLLKDIIMKAGVPVWVKPFQNMRSTRETELAHEWPLHVVCAWIGNSQAVAREHYLQVRDEDFTRAAGGQQPSGSRRSGPAALAGQGGPKSGPASVGSGRGERHGVPASASPTSKNPAPGPGCRSAPPGAAPTVKPSSARERTRTIEELAGETGCVANDGPKSGPIDGDPLATRSVEEQMSLGDLASRLSGLSQADWASLLTMLAKARATQ